MHELFWSRSLVLKFIYDLKMAAEKLIFRAVGIKIYNVKRRLRTNNKCKCGKYNVRPSLAKNSGHHSSTHLFRRHRRTSMAHPHFHSALARAAGGCVRGFLSPSQDLPNFGQLSAQWLLFIRSPWCLLWLLSGHSCWWAWSFLPTLLTCTLPFLLQLKI